METRLPADFSDFLRSLNEAAAEYLVVGGYAVGYHGYVRVTGDIDVWVRQSPENAERVVQAVRTFGFEVPGLTPSAFLGDGRIIRMGQPPRRVEILTSISGVAFEDAWAQREVSDWDGVSVPLLSLGHLRQNKKAAGRLKDLADLQELPEVPPSDPE